MRVKVLSFLGPLFDVLELAVGRQALLRSMLNSRLDFSSQFTGWSCADKSLLAIGVEANRRGLAFHPTLVSACEIDRAASKVILDELCAGGACLFDDVIELANLRKAPPASLGLQKSVARAMRGGKACPRKKWPICKKHRKRCAPRTGDMAVAGSSCTDFSSIGARRGVRGKTLTATLAWLRIMKHKRLGLHENVRTLALPHLAMISNAFGVR